MGINIPRLKDLIFASAWSKKIPKKNHALCSRTNLVVRQQGSCVISLCLWSSVAVSVGYVFLLSPFIRCQIFLPTRSTFNTLDVLFGLLWTLDGSVVVLQL